MTVRDAVAILNQCDQDVQLGVSVGGHTHYGDLSDRSHGPMEIHDTRIHFAGGSSRQIVLITGWGGFPQDGYKPESLRNLTEENNAR